MVRGVPSPGEGELTDLLGRDREKRLTYVADGPGKGVQEARLGYRVLAVRDGLSLVRVRLYTGRTHQIRVQFASRGWPLAGDRRYGAEGDPIFPIALWSYRLSFLHPETGEAVAFEKAPPEIEPWSRFDPI